MFNIKILFIRISLNIHVTVKIIAYTPTQGFTTYNTKSIDLQQF